VKRYSWRTGLLELSLLVCAAIFAFPFYILFSLSLKSSDVSNSPLSLPKELRFENYGDAWTKANLGSAMWNSFLITFISVTLILVLSLFAAYPLARIATRLSKSMYWLFLFGLLLPFQVALIPLYQSIRDIGLLGSIWSVILVYVGLQMPFSIFLYAGFLRAVPKDYEEAAWVDGASTWTTLRTIVFPLLRPITATVAILNTIFIWNDFLTPLLYLTGTDKVTIPVALFAFVGQYVSSWPLVFAGLVSSTLPILLLFFILQKSVMKGFAGGLKG
jgi:raffinose/stachyose/melibiose transport system permease protein